MFKKYAPHVVNNTTKIILRIMSTGSVVIDNKDNSDQPIGKIKTKPIKKIVFKTVTG